MMMYLWTREAALDSYVEYIYNKDNVFSHSGTNDRENLSSPGVRNRRYDRRYFDVGVANSRGQLGNMGTICEGL